MTAATDLTADVQRAQAALDALVDEQRNLPGLISHISRGDNADQWARLALRQASIAHEIRDATADVLRARLAAAWAEAEAAIPVASEAHTERDDANRVLADYDAARRPRAQSYADVAAAHLERSRIRDTANAARVRHLNAQRAAEGALFLVDELEDELEVVTGTRPEPGEGLRATPAPLDATYVLATPTSTAGHHIHEAGSVPRRWVAHRVSGRH